MIVVVEKVELLVCDVIGLIVDGVVLLVCVVDWLVWICLVVELMWVMMYGSVKLWGFFIGWIIGV